MSNKKIFLIIIFVLTFINSLSSQIDTITLLTTYSNSAPVRDIKIIGNYAFIIFQDLNIGYSGTLKILDITNPENPILISSCNFNTASSIWGNAPSYLYVKDNYVYICNWVGGLIIINVSDIYHPFVVGKYTDGCGDWGTAMCDLVVEENYAYIAWDYNYGLGIFDISNPSNPKKVSNYGNISFARGIVKYGNYVYVATYYGGYVRVFDVRNPETPNLIYNITTPGVAWYVDIDISGDYLYIADCRDTYGLKIYNISNPSNPVYIGKYDTTGFGYGWSFDIEVKNNYAYLTFQKGIAVFDVSNPANPLLKAKLYLTNIYGTGRLDVSNDYIYVSSQEGFLILQTSTKADHFKIIHDGEGVVGIPERIIVKAMDKTNNIISNYTGIITLYTKGGNKETISWSNISGRGEFQDLGAGTDRAIYKFVLKDKGIVTLAIKDTTAESLNIEATDGIAKDDDTEGILEFKYVLLDVRLSKTTIQVRNKEYSTIYVKALINNKPVSDILINFKILSGNGTISPFQTITKKDGIAIGIFHSSYIKTEINKILITSPSSLDKIEKNIIAYYIPPAPKPIFHSSLSKLIYRDIWKPFGSSRENTSQLKMNFKYIGVIPEYSPQSYILGSGGRKFYTYRNYLYYRQPSGRISASYPPMINISRAFDEDICAPTTYVDEEKNVAGVKAGSWAKKINELFSRECNGKSYSIKSSIGLSMVNKILRS